MDQPDRAKDVDVELGARLFHLHVLDGTIGAIAGIVDEDVDATEFGDDGFDPGLHGSVISHVHRQNFDTGLRQTLHVTDTARGAVNRVAEFLELEGSGFPDTGRSAGDKCDFVGHVPVPYVGNCCFQSPNSIRLRILECKLAASTRHGIGIICHITCISRQQSDATCRGGVALQSLLTV
ncbi:hypothetical protein D3C73_465470 [compost metagenome]